jgi:hypothetical protein
MSNVIQAQNFGDIHVGEQSSLIINQVLQIAVSEIKTRAFRATSPYLGLRLFEAHNKDFFFGRDRLIAELVQRVTQRNLVLVMGASGSGKSSVVRAGLLPFLTEQFQPGCFRSLVMTPDRDPFLSLRAALQGARVAQDKLAALDVHTAESVVAVLTGQRPSDERWLLFVDQFEEIFTLCADAAVRKAFLDGLTQLAKLPQIEIKIVLAMRADFLDRLGPHPGLGGLAQQGLQLVLDMESSELRAAIEQPAAKHGVVFEDGLVEQIIGDVKGRAGALPLLQYTLDLLWQSDDPSDDRTLNTTSYHQVGGVEGAVRQRADEIYQFSDRQKQTPRTKEQQEWIRQIFLRVVDLTSQGAGARVVSRRAPLTEFVLNEEQTLIKELVNENLLVTNATRLGGSSPTNSTVELAHEALLSAWPNLKEWIEQARDVIYVRNRLSVDANKYAEILGRDPSRAEEELWRGSRLGHASELRQRGDFSTVLGGLSPEEESFLSASLERSAQEERKQRRRIRSLIGGLVAIVVVVSGLAFYAWHEQRTARHQEEIAKSRALLSAANTLLTIDPSAALLVLREVGEQQRDDRWRLTALAALDQPIVDQKVFPRWGKLEALNTVRAWVIESVRKGEESLLLLRTLDGNTPLAQRAFKQPNCVRFAGNRALAVIHNEQGIWLWSLDKNEASLILKKEGVLGGRSCPDTTKQGTLLAWCQNRYLYISDISESKPLISPSPLKGLCKSVRFDSRGEQVFVVSYSDGWITDLKGQIRWTIAKEPDEELQSIHRIRDDLYVLLSRLNIKAGANLHIPRSIVRIGWPNGEALSSSIYSMTAHLLDNIEFLPERNAFRGSGENQNSLFEIPVLQFNQSTLFPAQSGVLSFAHEAEQRETGQFRLSRAAVTRVDDLADARFVSFEHDGSASLWSWRRVHYPDVPAVVQMSQHGEPGWRKEVVSRVTSQPGPAELVVRWEPMHEQSGSAIEHKVSKGGVLSQTCPGSNIMLLLDAAATLHQLDKGVDKPLPMRLPPEETFVSASCDGRWLLSKHEKQLIWRDRLSGSEQHRAELPCLPQIGIELAPDSSVALLCTDRLAFLPGRSGLQAFFIEAREGERLVAGGFGAKPWVVLTVFDAGASKSRFVLRDVRAAVQHEVTTDFKFGNPTIPRLPDVSPDLQWLALPNSESVRLVSVADSSITATLPVASGGSVAFRPDGGELMWTGLFGGWRTWPLTTGEIGRAVTRATQGTSLSKEERRAYLIEPE